MSEDCMGEDENKENGTLNLFLEFLEKDMGAHPENILPISKIEMDEILTLIDEHAK